MTDLDAATTRKLITPTPAQDARLNEFERGFVAQCRPLDYRTICNRVVCDPTVDRIAYSELVVCACADVKLMWVQDGGRKTVYRLCALHGLVYNGHLGRVRRAPRYEDNQRQHNSRRGWSTR